MNRLNGRFQLKSPKSPSFRRSRQMRLGFLDPLAYPAGDVLFL
jgi:hypothetical protein